jgi:copper chaperone
MLDLTIGGRFKISNLSTNYRQEISMNQTFTVSGMTCGHCEKAVTRAVKQVDPNAEIKIDRNSGKVDVVSGQSRELLVKAIVEEGYEVAA